MKEMNCGNFIELLKLMEDFNDELKSKRLSLPNIAKYTSPQIQNEMLTIFTNMIRDHISEELQK